MKHNEPKVHSDSYPNRIHYSYILSFLKRIVLSQINDQSKTTKNIFAYRRDPFKLCIKNMAFQTSNSPIINNPQILIINQDKQHTCVDVLFYYVVLLFFALFSNFFSWFEPYYCMIMIIPLKIVFRIFFPFIIRIGFVFL